jgi:hypothetical protein
MSVIEWSSYSLSSMASQVPWRGDSVRLFVVSSLAHNINRIITSLAPLLSSWLSSASSWLIFVTSHFHVLSVTDQLRSGDDLSFFVPLPSVLRHLFVTATPHVRSDIVPVRSPLFLVTYHLISTVDLVHQQRNFSETTSILFYSRTTLKSDLI